MAVRRIFHRLSDDRGVSLTELLVVIFLMTTIGIIFSQVLASSLDATRDLEGSASANDDLRLALAAIDNELRSAETICEPTPGGTSDRLHFVTRRGTGMATVETEYVYELQDLDGDGAFTDLMKSSDGGVTYRRVVGSVVNLQVAADLGVPQPLFESQGATELGSGGTVEASPSFGRVMSVAIWAEAGTRDHITPRLETTEIAGRNVWTPNAASC